MTDSLHSRILGEGKPLIILHGFLGMSDNWKSLGSRFSKEGFQVHLVDQRNHGRSFHSEDFDYAVMAADLFAYVGQHHLSDAMIIGHSMGGKTAMQFACSFPDLVHKLVVADIAPKTYPPHHQHILYGLEQLDFSSLKSRTEADQELSKHITEIGIRQFLLKNLFWAENGNLALRFNLDVLKSRMNEIGENIGDTDQFNGPTLFLKGDKSDYIDIEDVAVIKEHFPMARVESIENAGHWLHAENPSQFYNKVKLFLNQ